MTEYPDKEEQYLLRVQDKDAADRIRELLRAPVGSNSEEQPAPLELRFTTKDGKDPQAREGVLTVDGQTYQVKRQDLPTIVESFKTYDDTNLVKAGDIGQVIMVPGEGSDLPEGLEARNGLTKAMQDARKRRFRKARQIDPRLIRETEDAILQIAGGGAPVGYEFIDEEEEYVISANGKSGSWQPYQPKKANGAAPAPVPSKKPPAKRKPAKRKDAAAADSSLAGAENI